VFCFDFLILSSCVQYDSMEQRFAGGNNGSTRDIDPSIMVRNKNNL
jgi:hypothetical protein